MTIYTLIRRLIRHILIGHGRHVVLLRVDVTDDDLQQTLDRYDYPLTRATWVGDWFARSIDLEGEPFIVLEGIRVEDAHRSPSTP